MLEINPREFVQEMARPIERVAALASARQADATAFYKETRNEAVKHEVGSKSRIAIYTDVDIEIQDILLSFIRKRWPFVSVLAEEDTPERSTFRHGHLHCVLLDPIDGTRNFLDGSSSYCHIVSLMKGPAMVATLVYSHVGDRLFRAVVGAGASVSCPGSELAGLRLRPTQRRTFLYHVSRVPSVVVDGVSRLGFHMEVSRQNATDLLSMFDNGIRGFISVAPMIYDVWSPAMIVQEAGGWLSDWRGAPPAFDGQQRLLHLLVARTEADAHRILPLLGRYVESVSQEWRDDATAN